MTLYYVTVQSEDVVEVEANSAEEAEALVEQDGADVFESVNYVSEVIKVEEVDKFTCPFCPVRRADNDLILDHIKEVHGR